MILLPIFMTLSPRGFNRNYNNLLWISFFLTMVFLIGFRYETGGDWVNYILSYEYIKNINLSDIFTLGDLTYNIGFKIFVWFSEKYFNGQYLANLGCAVIFLYGLSRFCNNLPNRWLALSIAMPYLVIVIGIGYTRQAAAIGFLLLAFMNIDKSNRYFLYIVLGSLFHNTIIILLLIGFIHNFKLKSLNTWYHLSFLSIIIFIFYSNLIDLTKAFTSVDTVSHGGQLRMMINVLAGFLLFSFRKRYKANYTDYKLWLIVSIICLILFPISFLYSASIDRVGLYFIPLQLAVFTKVSTLIRNEEIKALFITLLLSCYVLFFLIWIQFGVYSTGWYPYRNVFFKNTDKIYKPTSQRSTFWGERLLTPCPPDKICAPQKD